MIYFVYKTHSRRPRPGSIGATIDEIDRLGAWNSALESSSDVPLMEESSLRHGTLIPVIGSDQVGTCSHQGRRTYQEDRFIVMQLEVEGGGGGMSESNAGKANGNLSNGSRSMKHNNDGEGSLLLLAVFDGHGGAQCVDYCHSNLPRYAKYLKKYYLTFGCL